MQTPSTASAKQPRVFAAKRPSPRQPEYKDPDKVSLTSVCVSKRQHTGHGEKLRDGGRERERDFLCTILLLGTWQ